MATISFEEKVVVIEDKDKAKEIQTALDCASKAFENVEPAINDTKVKENVKKWFCR